MLHPLNFLIHPFSKAKVPVLLLPVKYLVNDVPVRFVKLFTSVVDPHWFQCGSGDLMTKKCKAFFAHLDLDPDPSDQNHCGSKRIRIRICDIAIHNTVNTLVIVIFTLYSIAARDITVIV